VPIGTTLLGNSEKDTSLGFQNIDIMASDGEALAVFFWAIIACGVLALNLTWFIQWLARPSCEEAFVSGFATSKVSYEDEFIRFACFTEEALKSIKQVCSDPNVRSRALGNIHKHRFDFFWVTPTGCFTDYRVRDGNIFS